ncbi:MAG: PsbP-related protein [Cyclobacteriaceae bacterium]
MKEFCPYCSKSIPPESIFCVHCGGDLRFYKKNLGAEEKIQSEREQESSIVNCTYCQKTSSEGLNFCVHCGKEIKTAITPKIEEYKYQVETTQSSPTKKLSSIFNMLILLVATASIGGFIYFYIENKLSTPADKNPINEEIVDNLYRNTKYQFRIKFPESWEIKKGDGPNILVKASNGEGSSINIYVKDLGIELGDIDELISIEEWASSVAEKFPTAKVLSKKEVHLDNRKAYFIQYAVNYKALDLEADMIFYNVSLVNKNFTYAITAGSEESRFQDIKQILDQSVRTFVIEDYGTDIDPSDNNSTFQSDNAPVAKETEESESKASRPWFRNSLLGISFETPKMLEEQSANPPAGYEDYITKFKTYFSKESDLIVFFMYAESKFDTYDKEAGLNGAISNMVNSMNGTDLKLEFSEPKSNHDDLRCSGSYKLQGTEVQVKGYVYWNGKGKFFLLTTMGDRKDLKSMDKVIESLRINIP